MSNQIEVEKRNHRKLGQQLELFMPMEEAPGMPFFLPKGMAYEMSLNILEKKASSSRLPGNQDSHYDEAGVMGAIRPLEPLP